MVLLRVNCNIATWIELLKSKWQINDNKMCNNVGLAYTILLLLSRHIPIMQQTIEMVRLNITTETSIWMQTVFLLKFSVFLRFFSFFYLAAVFFYLIFQNNPHFIWYLLKQIYCILYRSSIVSISIRDVKILPKNKGIAVVFFCSEFFSLVCCYCLCSESEVMRKKKLQEMLKIDWIEWWKGNPFTHFFFVWSDIECIQTNYLFH